MFENYKEMNDAEKASVKAIHTAIRKEAPSRHGNLAWAFVRGFKYRRVERTTRTQVMADGSVVNHNPPSVFAIAAILVKAMPALETLYFRDKYGRLADTCPLYAWVADPSGAIPAPVREKKPYVAQEGAA